jgi:hypothetical protein
MHIVLDDDLLREAMRHSRASYRERLLRADRDRA